MPAFENFKPLCATAINKLKELYIKPKNEIYARHLLSTRRQQTGETIDEYLLALRTLAKDCNFVQVSAQTYSDEYMRDSFISGISSNSIRQRLLENKTVDLNTIIDQARSLDRAFQNSESYTKSVPNVVNSICKENDVHYSEANLAPVEQANVSAI